MSYLHIIAGGLGLFVGYKAYCLYQKYNSMYSMLVHDTNYKNSIILHQHHAEIPYYYNGQPYTIRVPYNRSQMAKMDEYLVWADEKNITQQPGIPYMVNADALGCEKIRSCNADTEEVFVYSGAPMYL